MTVSDIPLMNPVLRRGRSYLDRELLPGDENESRLTALLAQVAERDLDPDSLGPEPARVTNEAANRDALGGQAPQER